ncbi:hypothetical protein [Rhodopseudomonas pseudopalustris]|uniref:Uncharacterized protein n=1 Tax=Rhodopseudomonas pseudopalustris TaxID=1513892 RepID=A0A1H8V885_9BRAD|nr:hypothetical protein [Rhodopseudomonas pseudopalustris]SEP11672.1 hypothetical protein SAMN05444123_108120 [Rhodopseudomonas pseudopalustris]
MFKIVSNPTFTHTVTVMMPVDSGHAEETLLVTYNYLDTAEVEQFDLKSTDGTSSFLSTLIRKIDGLTDSTGQPVACTLELREKLLRMANVRLALLRHYFDAVTKVREGN